MHDYYFGRIGKEKQSDAQKLDSKRFNNVFHGKNGLGTLFCFFSPDINPNWLERQNNYGARTRQASKLNSIKELFEMDIKGVQLRRTVSDLEEKVTSLQTNLDNQAKTNATLAEQLIHANTKLGQLAKLQKMNTSRHADHAKLQDNCSIPRRASTNLQLENANLRLTVKTFEALEGARVENASLVKQVAITTLDLAFFTSPAGAICGYCLYSDFGSFVFGGILGMFLPVLVGLLLIKDIIR